MISNQGFLQSFFFVKSNLSNTDTEGTDRSVHIKEVMYYDYGFYWFLT